MPFFEERQISDAIEINATPEQAFAYVTGIVDDRTYRAWHEQDHVSFKWLSGEPWAEGSILCAREYLQGRLHKMKFVVTQVDPNSKIVYSPLSRIIRHFFPQNEFIFEPKGEGCLFKATGTYRIGWIGRKFFHRAIDKGLASVRQHVKEEGENMKKALEKDDPPA